MSDAATLAQKGDVSDACVAYQQILKDQPDTREALDGAAVCLFELKRYDEALVLEERLASLGAGIIVAILAAIGIPVYLGQRQPQPDRVREGESRRRQRRFGVVATHQWASRAGGTRRSTPTYNQGCSWSATEIP